ncbi:hypothetical protein TMatcc_006915 [Talaromyces marneffei ATCC 18224]
MVGIVSELAPSFLPLEIDGGRWTFISKGIVDISHELRTALAEEYFEEEQPSDGEIYQKIRRYQQEHNAVFERTWWARLTDDKARYLRQLSKNIDICSAFDGLLSIPGLWGGMSLEDVAKMMALRCDEEIVHYLTSHLRKFWASLVSPDPTNPDLEAMMKIDAHTVERLELMAPKASYRDARKVQRLLHSGKVLSNFNLSERARMWKWLRDYDGIIPTLRTFFRDIKYLKECGNAMKLLINFSKTEPTVRQALQCCYSPRDSLEEGCLIQTSEDTFESRFGSLEVQQELSYRQLWLHAMRVYPRISRTLPTPNSLAKSQNKTLDALVVYEMAMFAHKLGFQSPAIKKLITHSPDAMIAQSVLLHARDQEGYEYDAKVFPTLVHRIVECFSMATPREHPQLPSLVDSTAGLKERCGIPSGQAQRHDHRLLFLDRLHTDRVAISGTVSTWYVRRNVYFAFFGRLPSNSLGVPVSISSTFPRDRDVTSRPSRDVYEGSEIRAPWVEFTEPMLGPSNAEHRTKIANPTTQPGEVGEEVVAKNEVSDQTQSLSEEEFSVVVQEHFLRGQDESALRDTNLGDASLEENEPESDKPQSPGLPEPGSPDGLQPGTRSCSNSTSPSLQLQQDLSNFIARIHVSTNPQEDDLQQSGQSRSHIINHANNARKRKHTNDDDTGAYEKLNSASKRRRSRTRNIAGTHSSPLNEAESIRFNLLRTLMKRAGQSFNIATLRQIYEIGDRIIYETNVILNGWNEWLSRECQAPGVVLPAYHNLSSAEICFAACRLLVSTHESFHHESVYGRLAQVLLHIFVPEIKKEVKERQDRGERFLNPNHRKPVTIAHDLILENVSEFERNGKRPCRQNLVQHKNFGKRWWRLGSGIGLVVILTCSSDLATSHMKSRSFSDATINLLVNYVRNAYPSAVAHLQSLDPIIQRLIANGSLSANNIIQPCPFLLRYEALPENIQWTNTQSAMGVATEKLLRSLGKTKE